MRVADGFLGEVLVDIAAFAQHVQIERTHDARNLPHTQHAQRTRTGQHQPRHGRRTKQPEGQAGEEAQTESHPCEHDGHVVVGEEDGSRVEFVQHAAQRPHVHGAAVRKTQNRLPREESDEDRQRTSNERRWQQQQR